MAAQKVYQIQINGLTESVKAVDALNDSLKQLESRINALQGKAVSVGAKASAASALSEEEKIQKQIEAIEEKRLTNAKEIYREYLKSKDALKEVENNQKSIASAERLDTKTYANTIAGMKQELADIKSAMQNVDLGDTDVFEKMTQRANELNGALKKIEESYGQFGRNVGNYKSAADGFKGLKIDVAGVNQEFDSAKQAAKALGNELQTLQVKKDRGIMLSDEELKRFEELPEIVAQLKSSIQDAGKPMDDLMDAMQSIVAIAQTTKGFSALFGLDGDKIERSIQKLVALQNAMKGLEIISKQLQEKQGIGKMLSVADKAYDALTKKVLAANTAILGTGKAAQVASVGIIKLASAFKVLMRATIVMAAISLVMELFDKAIEKIAESFKKAEEAAEKEKEVQKELGKVYATASANLVKYTTIVQNFNGTKKQEEKLVKQLNSELGDSLGTYKSLSEWQDVLTKKGAAYIQMLVLQAKAQAAFNKLVDAQTKESEARDKATDEYMGIIEQVQNFLWSGWGTKSANKARVAAIQAARAYTDEAEEEFVDVQKKVEDFMEKNGIGDYAPQIDKGGKKTADAAEKAQKEITSVELKAMRDGLNKRLMQLEEEKRQTINELKKNGKATAAEIKKIEDAYYSMQIAEINKYVNEITKTIEETSKKLKETTFTLNIKRLEQDIKDIENYVEYLQKHVVPIESTLTTNVEYSSLTKGIDKNSLKDAYAFDTLQKERNSSLINLEEFEKAVLDTYKHIFGIEKKDAIEAEMELEEHFSKELKMIREYGYKEEKTLNESFNQRLDNLIHYNEKYIEEIINDLKEEQLLREKHLSATTEQAKEAESDRYSIQMYGLKEQKKEVEKGLKAIEKAFNVSGLKEVETLSGTNKEVYKKYNELFANGVEIDAQIETAKEQHKKKLEQITREQEQNQAKIEKEGREKRAAAQQVYFDKQISNYRDFISKINNELQKQPITDKAGWNIVDIGAAYKTYKELETATKTTFENIQRDKEELDEKFKNGLITAENRNTTMKQLNDLETETTNSFENIKLNLKNLLSNFQQSINQYIQAGLQAVQDVMSAFESYQNYQFEKEQDALDKENDLLQEKLDKQEDIISKHKDKIDSIEDELATARGDRRQHLIDQLNAEVAAQRKAQKEKQKLEKQEEEAKKKQDDLDKQRREAEYKRNIMSIIVSTAMATANGLATQPFVPVGIAMGALATTLGMVQLALARAQKPYAKGGQLDGGVAVGNRHRDGGIKVLGGRAEIEGGEFITNRQTTAKNIDLLEYVNSKKKKIDISDMLEFYNGGRVRSSIKGARTRFEDGGYIPTLPNNIDIREQLQDVIVNQDNRPIYVSVVDINNKQDDVRRVQTLAGL